VKGSTCERLRNAKRWPKPDAKTTSAAGRVPSGPASLRSPPGCRCACAAHIPPLHPTALHFTSLHFTSLHFTSLHFTSLHFTSLHTAAPHRTPPHRTALRRNPLHSTAPHITPPHRQRPRRTYIGGSRTQFPDTGGPAPAYRKSRAAPAGATPRRGWRLAAAAPLQKCSDRQRAPSLAGGRSEARGVGRDSSGRLRSRFGNRQRII
jgi:hypothetical protein